MAEQLKTAGKGTVVPVQQGQTALRAQGRRRGDRRDHELHEHLEPGRHGRRRTARAQRGARGLQRKPWVKTSLAPGSKVVTDYLTAATCSTISRRSASTSSATAARPASATPVRCPTEIAEGRQQNEVVGCAVLSGNRNFEGRIHPLVRMNFLASPPLVVAYALAGNMEVDLTPSRSARRCDGKPVYLRDIWPTTNEIDDSSRKRDLDDVQVELRAACSTATRTGTASTCRRGDSFTWSDDSTYVKKPPYFDGMPLDDAARRRTSEGARVLALLGDSVTTDHISPAGDIAPTSPAGNT